MTKVKICGLTRREDVEYINEAKPDFVGFVMFFPKSKRNISCEKAKKLLSLLNKDIKSVAVTVCPDMYQLKQIYDCGFDLVQIHGEVSDEILSNPYLKVLRAFNVTDIDQFEKYSKNPNISGYVFDSVAPGSGKVFDWSIIKSIPRDDKLMLLAGGLDPDNVAEAISQVKPDGVDVSSGVENDSGNGKNREKIFKFINNTRQVQL